MPRGCREGFEERRFETCNCETDGRETDMINATMCPRCGSAGLLELSGKHTFECGSSQYPREGFKEAPTCVSNQRFQLKKKIHFLELALSIVVPACEHLHHDKQRQHKPEEACPCVALIKKAQAEIVHH